MSTVLYCGDPHGEFRHIIDVAVNQNASAVVLLGDMEPKRPLQVELEPILDRVWWIPGNHDADSDEVWQRVWGSEKLADRNVHGRVVTLPDGTRLAGLGGVFREAVWHPDPASIRQGSPAFQTRADHAKVTPRQDRWKEGHHRKHWGTIYPEEFWRMAELKADVLITHESPGYHPRGVSQLDELAQLMEVKISVHGHHHDSLDSTARWVEQGFKSFGVGLRGITAIDAVTGIAKVIVPGQRDEERRAR
jgi:predicted phosphodiesterase